MNIPMDGLESSTQN